MSLQPPNDVLYRTVALPHTLRLPILGVPVRFLTNYPEVRAAVLEMFGMWQALEAHPHLLSGNEGDELCVRIVVHEGTELGAAPTPMVTRMPDRDRVLVHTPGSVGVADTSRGDGVAYVTRDLVADRDRLERGIVEAFAMVLVSTRDRLPLHASMIAKDGVAIALAGRSGLGKSTLAYQALRAGWTLLADDGVYLQTVPRMRWWGRPRHLYLPPDAPRWFPELAGRTATLQANGKHKIAIAHTHDWAGFGPPVADRATVCVLARADRAALEPVPAEVISAMLIEDLAVTHDLYGDAPSRIIPTVCADGGWRLSLSGNPTHAVPLLEELTERITG